MDRKTTKVESLEDRPLSMADGLPEGWPEAIAEQWNVRTWSDWVNLCKVPGAHARMQGTPLLRAAEQAFFHRGLIAKGV
jgi:hypothetical protein